MALLQQRMKGEADAPSEAPATAQHRDSGHGDDAVHEDKENVMTKPALSAELQWIKDRLDSMPRGSKTRLADLMHRHPNDLSAWLGSHRAMPESAKRALAAALPAFDAQMAAQFRQAFPHSDIAGWMGGENDAPGAATDDDVTAASAPQESAPKSAAAPETKTPVLVKRRAGAGTYVSFRRHDNEPSLEEVIAQAANTLAHVLSSIVDRQHENSHH